MAVVVYEAGNIVDAQLVLDDLIAAGLKAHMSGDYLSGAAGELPAGQMIKVWIARPEHAQRARDVVTAYEHAQSSRGEDKPCHQCNELLGPQFGRCWNCGAWQAVE